MTRRGVLIVVEGCDRSGKSTQCRLLVDALNNSKNSTVLKKFPDRTTATGKIINEYLQNTSDLDDRCIHLLFSANRWEAMREFESLLNKGVNIVVDRYAYSGVSFSAAKGLDIEWCKSPDKGLLSPDIVLFFDLDPNVAKTRGDYGQERYEKLAFQAKAREMFLKLGENDPVWQIINADDSIEGLHKVVLSKVESFIDNNLSDLKHNLWL